ncbi:hypothetical protein PV08_11798 [Exophiala spinifera]|uniref:Asl1-like glycosyl hydrolase catalytic domain-containing protein n=1 Tax=Exophiala spinifera TaxID=91928 RepID=A0A0D1ZAL3_9EURO|nr:uncharacterized protein PV08_11798 [Exophiala spinifera]KIW10022.1 hypothetical protein PV08_11798 [Exophiala spinifera]
MRSSTPSFWFLFLSVHLTLGASVNSTSKRGLIYISTSHSSDDDSIFIQSGSPLSWYYNYSPWPTDTLSGELEFVPMVHGASNAQQDVGTVKTHSNASHVLSFNEPDISSSDGGTNTSPRDAAKAYLDFLAPLREEPYNLKVSLPSTSGSASGLTWLSNFNKTCHSLNSTHGCPFDFIATHFYGPFSGLTSWLGNLHTLYPEAKIWLTEFAIPDTSDTEALAMMNESLPYLDGLDYLERYSWFGSFRSDDANEWTGDGVSMLDDHGKLTSLGAQYLGGQANGFKEGQGQNKEDNGGGAMRDRYSLALMIAGVGVSIVLAC